MSTAPITVDGLLAMARRRLKAAGIEGAAIDARVLVGGVLGLDLAGLVASGPAPVDDGVVAEIEAAVARRLAGEPPGRILGRRAFHGLDFELGPDTLEPRPDTEVLVDAAVAAVRSGAVPGAGADGAGLVFADLGTGTGAIAVAIAVALPAARGVAVDLAPGAVAIARRNATAHGVADRVEIIRSNWFEVIEGGSASSSPIRPTSRAPSLRRSIARCASMIRRWRSTAATTGSPPTARSWWRHRTVLSPGGADGRDRVDAGGRRHVPVPVGRLRRRRPAPGPRRAGPGRDGTAADMTAKFAFRKMGLENLPGIARFTLQ